MQEIQERVHIQFIHRIKEEQEPAKHIKKKQIHHVEHIIVMHMIVIATLRVEGVVAQHQIVVTILLNVIVDCHHMVIVLGLVEQEFVVLAMIHVTIHVEKKNLDVKHGIHGVHGLMYQVVLRQQVIHLQGHVEQFIELNS